MNQSIRRIAWASFGVVGLLAAWLTVQQAIAGSSYADDPRNARALPDPGDTARGIVTTADGVLVAQDIDGVRTYPQGATYLHLVGVATGEAAIGLEGTRTADLRSRDDGSITAWLIDLLGGSNEPPEVRLTVVDRLQQAAAAGLQGHTGAVVALDPATGAVLAYASSPTTDPNDLVSGTADFASFADEPAALDRVSFRLLPPGSTFKMLVAAAALEQGARTDTRYRDATSYLAPDAGQPITNVTGGTCAGGGEITLRQALAVSCNTVFAELAVDLGGSVVAGIAERAWFNANLPFELGIALASIPSGAELEADPGALAQTGLGERDVRVTPLQMAVITAGVGNGGTMMRPYVVAGVIARDGTILEGSSPEELGRLLESGTAADLTSMMVDVVATGTGRAAAQPGIQVAGKTGTAEGSGGPHSWFVALAPAEAPTIAIVVMIEGEGTGGTTAAPIASQILRAWFR